ncbi:fas-associated death domain protein-like [Drosophila hydei]|uniref:Fas-associated death domain protein-like n=1 Tax=Drosophila hydei TaxID=7224 RepID=A0A6J1LEA9_DROHY|nr:fas-associated death domain protein-like [Drosophila hydei]
MDTGVHWSYDVLKKMEIEGASEHDLDWLKESFAIEIGSPKNVNRINTIKDLIDCLEQGGQISEENIEPLLSLGKNNMQPQEAVDNYLRVERRAAINCFQELSLAEELKQQLYINPQRAAQPAVAAPQHCVTVTQFKEAKRAAVFKKISQQLGRSWRDLGRKLNISEGTMDEIEMLYPQDFKSRILRLLQIFEEDECNDPRQLLLQLCRGLSECGRKDLRYRVEQIMSH